MSASVRKRPIGPVVGNLTSFTSTRPSARDESKFRALGFGGNALSGFGRSPTGVTPAKAAPVPGGLPAQRTKDCYLDLSECAVAHHCGLAGLMAAPARQHGALENSSSHVAKLKGDRYQRHLQRDRSAGARSQQSAHQRHHPPEYDGGQKNEHIEPEGQHHPADRSQYG